MSVHHPPRLGIGGGLTVNGMVIPLVTQKPADLTGRGGAVRLGTQEKTSWLAPKS